MSKQQPFQQTYKYQMDSHSHILASKYASTRQTDLRIQEIKKKYQTPKHRYATQQSFPKQRIETQSEQQYLPRQLKQANTNIKYNESNRSYYEQKNERPPLPKQRKPNKQNKLEDSITRKTDMKQSLFKQKNLYRNESNINISQLNQFTKKDAIDPRIKNIDKINSKIKSILQNWQQNEKDKKRSMLDQFKECKDINSSFQETKLLDRKVINYTPQKAIEQLFGTSKKEDYKSEQKESKQQLPIQLMNCKNQRSKSCLGGENISNKINNNTQNLDKYNSEIDKILKRIHMFEQEKRKLNIDFKPFKYDKTHRSSYSLKFPLSGLQDKNKILNQKIQKIHQFKFEEEQQKIEEIYDNLQLRKKAGEGIKNRKLQLQIENHLNCQETKKFVELLTQQIQLDQELRNAKIWLSGSNISYEYIKDDLHKHSKQLSLKQIQKVFSMTDEEWNPFFTLDNCKQTIQSLIAKYIKSQNHWKEIVKKIDRMQLKQENIIDKIDLDRKGNIILADIVRLVNENDKFYRNRDLYLIWRRITNSQELSYQSFENIFS